MSRPRPSPGPRARVAVAAVAAFVLASCGGSGAREGLPERTVLQNKGSDTMVNVAQVWAEEYRKVTSDVEVEVSGGGSGVGIAALIRGAVDIANASRDLKPSEADEAFASTGKRPVDFKVGFDALAVFVHRDNPLSEITLSQLEEVFAETGTVTRWSQLGVTIPGARTDAIIRVSRQSSSGTYEFFRQKALRNRDFRLGSLDLNGSKEVVELVGVTPTAIGYSGMGYATPAVRMLRVARGSGDPAIPPGVATVHDGSYVLARSLHLYTLGEPDGAAKAYIDWILSEGGQRIVAESGYVPVAVPRPAVAP